MALPWTTQRGLWEYIYTGKGSGGTWRHRGRGSAADTPLAYTLAIFWSLPILILFLFFPFCWLCVVLYSISYDNATLISYSVLCVFYWLTTLTIFWFPLIPCWLCVVFCFMLTKHCDFLYCSGCECFVACVRSLVLYFFSYDKATLWPLILYCSVYAMMTKHCNLLYCTDCVLCCVFYLIVLYSYLTKQYCDVLFCVVVCILSWQNTAISYTVLTVSVLWCVFYLMWLANTLISTHSALVQLINFMFYCIIFYFDLHCAIHVK